MQCIMPVSVSTGQYREIIIGLNGEQDKMHWSSLKRCSAVCHLNQNLDMSTKGDIWGRKGSGERERKRIYNVFIFPMLL